MFRIARVSARRTSLSRPLLLPRYPSALSARIGRRAASTVTDIAAYPEVGEKLLGFTVQNKKHVPELHLTAIHLIHDKTNADYLHVARDDSNNVFGIGFKTNPPDATGVPHILEHTTLCGSEKYPVRDPFFKMLPRSLSNFMNAFTSADHTTYPFATTNKQDFQNLLSVYLDSTLHPLLKEEDFRQEGWRLGPDNPRAPVNTSEKGEFNDLVFKGVVYNEMKGQMSDATYLYWIRFQEHIFPEIHNSGGDPQHITDLTHKQLVDFSKRNYHPSNSKIFTYGDIPLKDHLGQVGSVLDGFTKAATNQEIKVPRPIQSPLSFVVPGPIDPFAAPDKQHKTSLSWLAGDTTDIVETFALGVVSSLLLDGYGSPMYKALIESGLGSAFTPNTGLDTSNKTPIFSVGINNISGGDVPLVKQRVQKVLEESFVTGFNDAKVQGLLHQLELTLKHRTAYFGMSIMEKIIGSWFNDSHPMKELSWNSVIDEFKARYERGHYLEGLMRRYLMNDKHLSFTMIGSQTYKEDLERAELARREAKLAAITAAAGSSEAAIAKLQHDELALLKVQESAQNADLSCLPTIAVKDISRKKERKPLRESKIDNVDVVWREAPTNGLSYFQALNRFDDLPNELRLLMPLFNDCIFRLGTRTRTMEEWEDLIKLKTGGISTSSYLVSSPTSLDGYSEGLQLSGYGLDQNLPAMLDMMSTLIAETDFTSPAAPAMILELLLSATNGALDAVAGIGHRFAANAASAGLSTKFWIQEQQSGLAQIQATADLLRAVQTDPGAMQQLINKLQAIQAFAISRSPRLRIRLVCEPSAVAHQESVLQKWLSSLPGSDVRPPPSTGAVGPTSKADKLLYDLPFQVSYAGLAQQTVPFTHPSSATLSVLAQLLTHNHLHPEIREKGGAYGAFAGSAPLQGAFTLASYRDPNPDNTLRVFEGVGTFARDRAWNEREMEEAKLGVFQALDAPQSVNAEGARYFMSGVTHEMDQRWRECVLDVTAAEVRAAADEQLVNGSRRVACLLGEAKDPAAKKGWEVKTLATDGPEA